MKRLIFLLALLLSPAAMAQDIPSPGSAIADWQIYQSDGTYRLCLKGADARCIELEPIGPGVELEKVDRPGWASHIALIEYRAGTAGTSVAATAFRAVIYDLGTQTFIGDAPVRVELSNGQVEKSRWTYTDGALTVEDDNYGTVTFKI